MIRTSLKFAANTSHANENRDAGQRAAVARGGAMGSSSRVRKANYQAPAGLFVRESSRLRYQSFETVAEAVRYANEDLPANKLLSCTLEAEDVHFTGEDVRQLYSAPGYPFRAAATQDE